MIKPLTIGPFFFFFFLCLPLFGGLFGGKAGGVAGPLIFLFLAVGRRVGTFPMAYRLMSSDSFVTLFLGSSLDRTPQPLSSIEKQIRIIRTAL